MVTVNEREVGRRRPCEHCGTVFAKRSSTHRFCSDRCRWRASMRRRYYDPDFVSQPIPPSGRYGLTCQRCGSVFGSKQNWATYCSRRCADAAKYLRRTRFASIAQAMAERNAEAIARADAVREDWDVRQRMIGHP